MPFEPTKLTSADDEAADNYRLVPISASSSSVTVADSPGGSQWIPILGHDCDFPPQTFEEVCLHLIRNPNINSSLLFRADIIYDDVEHDSASAVAPPTPSEYADRLLKGYRLRNGDIPGYQIVRTLVRSMVPRNPQLDKSILQTCHMLRSDAPTGIDHTLVVYIPHADSVEELPWYHPRVQGLVYKHTWRSTPLPKSQIGKSSEKQSLGSISLHYKLFPNQGLPLSDRLSRTGHHLLSTLYKHGNGALDGYEKRVHHDQLISQQRVQDTYAELKRKHAKRLCDRWVEKTEPSKHVFEDLGIAAFLIELWKDMYRPMTSSSVSSSETCTPTMSHATSSTTPPLPPFPGFVDIGCGNGVLVDILNREGYAGWGFDARRRKTWSTFDPPIQKNLKEMILIPQPLFEPPAPTPPNSSSSSSPLQTRSGLTSPLASPPGPGPGPGNLKRSKTWLNSLKDKLNAQLPSSSPPLLHNLSSSQQNADYHNGIFPPGTFIISNHADELTPWTPLLASISLCPFLAIPCCSHNFSGQRFRAPSVFNSYSADHFAPRFFASHVDTESKAVAIATSTFTHESCSPRSSVSESRRISLANETGDLKSLSPKARSKQPSAYASLCEWVAHLAADVGYVVEREMLRLPTTRNMGIVGRVIAEPEGGEVEERRMKRIGHILKREKADAEAWIKRAQGLKSAQLHAGTNHAGH